MPARDGSGPQGMGSRTGKGMGRCNPTRNNMSQSLKVENDQSTRQLGRNWISSIGRLIGRRSPNQLNRK